MGTGCNIKKMMRGLSEVKDLETRAAQLEEEKRAFEKDMQVRQSVAALR